MFNPIAAHEIGKAHQRDIRAWVDQQKLADSIDGGEARQPAGLRERIGRALTAMGTRLRARPLAEDRGEALSSSNC